MNDIKTDFGEFSCVLQSQFGGGREMIYTEEMKCQINSMGMEVVEFKKMVKSKRMFKNLEEIFIFISKNVSEIVKQFFEEIKKVLELPSKQTYKFIKSLGVKNYEVFSRRKQIHRARSCC